MTDDLYYRKLESTSTTELVDMIREKDKRIAELEAENERLTVSYETLKLHDEEEIGMLKSENAELKSGCGMCYRKDKEQLTKAKEIIKEFVEWANWQGNSKCPSFKSIQDKAEQFLSEVEK